MAAAVGMAGPWAAGGGRQRTCSGDTARMAQRLLDDFALLLGAIAPGTAATAQPQQP